MRGAMLFVAGLITGLAVSVALAQNAGVTMMNHVGINVPSIPDAVAYYTDKMGYREITADSMHAKAIAGAKQVR